MPSRFAGSDLNFSQFLLGNYAQVVASAKTLTLANETERLFRDFYVYRSLVAQRKVCAC